ncbi:polysaccharide deacetylase family protein [Streptomyces tailanensis]|uniref:polysaccharide deacetylase family protein n=1 Tax=Streptomyces tailanensis TaxID=2569858 RepID=UPI00122E817C|nr:polysaccharide deacetylase family protein [Streptomyces tailanensis]
MTKDQIFTRRRLLIGGAALLGAAGVAGTTASLIGDGASGTTAPPAAPAAGPAADSALPPSAYRLRPIAGYGGGPRRRKLVRPLVRRKPFLRVNGRGRTIVLTFDDGPDPRYTPDILRILRHYDVRAMFFVCGEMVAQYGDLLREMAYDGHVVGNHTWSHPLLTKLPRRRIYAEMARTSEIIDEAYGEPPLWFRAPYGAWNRAAFQFGAELNMEPLAWSVDTLDWRAPAADTIVERVANDAAPGVVVLSHDGGGDRSQSVRALRDYLPALLDSGYRITVPQRKYA